MIIGLIGAEAENRPLTEFTYFVDGAVISEFRHESESIIYAHKSTMAKIDPSSSPRVSQFGADAIVDGGRYISIGFPAGSCAPGDKYQGDRPETYALAGTLRPTGGITKAISVPSCEQALLRYYVKFPDGFDWRGGGKLPGLSSLDTSASGSNFTNAGITSFTARLMWQPGGLIIPYVYMPDNISRWGTVCGVNFGKSLPIVAGQWVKIEQYIRMNDVGQRNGCCRILIDDQELCNVTDIFWRTVPTLKIDAVYYCTFFGGHTFGFADNTYETIVDTNIFISDLFVSCL